MMLSLENRRGAVLIMVAFMMTMLLAFGAFAVDLTQVMAYRSELQRAADAAAHASAVELAKAGPAQAGAVARSFAALNPVMGRGPTVDSVQYGTWNDATKTFTLLCEQATCVPGSTHSATAMRVVLSGSGGSIFAQVLGQSSFTARASATGWAAPSVEETDCIRPWAIAYQDLTYTLDPTNPNLDRTLTARDLENLRTMSPSQLTFTIKYGAGDGSRGNYNAIAINGRGGSNYEIAIRTDCSSNTPRFGPGDVIETEPGNKVGPTLDGVVGKPRGTGPRLCDQVVNAICYRPGGQVGVPIKVVLWDGGEFNGRSSITVRMIASFMLTDVCESKGPCGVTGEPGEKAELRGYFVQMIDSGTIGTVTGTLVRPILVQ